ncbi:UNVERIFIED_CONTAM: hypothetical protein Sindi_0138700, partial [Sesamum indicum]
ASLGDGGGNSSSWGLNLLQGLYEDNKGTMEVRWTLQYTERLLSMRLVLRRLRSSAEGFLVHELEKKGKGRLVPLSLLFLTLVALTLNGVVWLLDFLLGCVLYSSNPPKPLFPFLALDLVFILKC